MADLGTAAVGLLVAAGGALATWDGIRTWRGQELAVVDKMLADPATRTRWTLGGRRLYQTFYGSGLANLGFGPGFGLIGVGLALKSTIDPDGDPAWWWVMAVVGVALLGVGGVYSLTYFWFGVPDGLRPPSQRGQPKPGQVGVDGRRHPLDGSPIDRR